MYFSELFSGPFAVNVLGKEQQAVAFTFFKAAFFECSLVDTLERGDHSVFLGQVIEASVNREISGRPDAMTLALADLGEKTLYGG